MRKGGRERWLAKRKGWNRRDGSREGTEGVRVRERKRRVRKKKKKKKKMMMMMMMMKSVWRQRKERREERRRPCKWV